MDVIKESNLKMLNEEEKGSCRTQLLEILQESTSPYSLVRNIHVNYKRGYMTEEDYIIKDIDIWPFIKNKFIQASNKDNYNDDELKSFWRDCIDYNGEIMSIDNACLEAYRRRIEKFPAYFINNFVRLGMRSTSPYYNTISCDDSWNKIFKDNNQFEMFLSKCKEDKVGKVSLVMRFWDLYKANDYHPIEFINEGDVQKKIDNGLVYEYNQYEKIKGIEEKLKSIPDSFENVQQREREIYLVNLEKMRDILEKIHINLRLKWKVLKSVKLKIGQIKLK